MLKQNKASFGREGFKGWALQRRGAKRKRRGEEEIMAAPRGDGCSSNGYSEKIKYLQGKRPEPLISH